MTVNENIKTLIRAPHYIGSVVLFQRNIASAEQLITLTNELQQTARDAGHTRPLFIAIDQENGLVTRIKPPIVAQLPGSMTLGATGSIADAIRVSNATAEVLDATGINMNYAPCCDVNSEPSNPVIGVRSIGDDGAFVGRVSSAIAQGFREKNIVPCIKHFPGHGDTKVDSHHGLPVVAKSRDQLEACELLPFRRATAEQIEAVMTSHIVFPALDDSALPMSVSKKCVDLLRSDLQYDGLFITDCLEMDAIRAQYGAEKGAVMAITAGVDCATICHTFEAQVGAYNEVYEAMNKGIIPLDRISKSVNRVHGLKDKFLCWESALRKRSAPDIDRMNTTHHALATEIYSRSATLARDSQQALPLPTHGSLAYVYPFEKPILTGAAGSGEVPAQTPCIPPAFLKILKSYNPGIVEYPVYEGLTLDDTTKDKISQADAVILATRNSKLSPHQQKLGQTVAGLSKKLIVVATCDPYDFIDDGEIKTYLAIYEPTAEAFLSASQIIFGSIKPSGRLPVLTKRSVPPITPFNPTRDLRQVIDLWHRLLPQYAVPASTLTDLLTRPSSYNFTVHAEDKVVGFIATYANEDRPGPTTFISAILVDETYQSQGIGTSLIEHARKYLRTMTSKRIVTIGSSCPRFWPGVPYDIPQKDQSFFVHRGFCPAPGPSARDYTSDLRTYEAPPGILERAAECAITFTPWCKEMYEECIRKQKEIFGHDPIWVGAYERLAQADQYSQAMVAVDSSGNQIGWTLMQELGVGLSQDLAFHPLLGEKSGQIGCVGVDPAARKKGVGLALVAHAALDLKRRGKEHVFIDWVALVNWYEKAGFRVWREYRPMSLNEIA